MTSSGEPSESAEHDSRPDASTPDAVVGPGVTGGLDLGGLLSQIGEMQQSLQEAQESVAARVVEGSAGGGAVRIKVSGGLEFESVTIAPEVVDREDIDLLQDLVLAAIRDAVERANEVQHEVLGAAGSSGGLAGLGDLGGLGGLLGGGPDDGRS